jgi:hypothetical protein
MSLSEGPDLLSDDFITLYYYDIIDACMAERSGNCLEVSVRLTPYSATNTEDEEYDDITIYEGNEGFQEVADETFRQTLNINSMPL